jgi:hypothetical protein
MRLAVISALVTAATLFGPPSITVTEVTGTPPVPGAVLAITSNHHTEEAEADISAKAISIRNGQQVSRPITITKAESKGRYGVTKQWESGTAWVLVFTIKQGDHGDHGSASSIVRVDAAGKVQGIEQTKSSNARGDRYNSEATQADIDRAFTQLGVRSGQ